MAGTAVLRADGKRHSGMSALREERPAPLQGEARDAEDQNVTGTAGSPAAAACVLYMTSAARKASR